LILCREVLIYLLRKEENMPCLILRARYKETFKSVLEKTRNAFYPLNIEISIIGFGDKITYEVEANPSPPALPE
jgi:hypothetical protein